METAIGDAYGLGIQAGWRDALNADALEEANPFPAGSSEAAKWNEGFADATGDWYASLVGEN